MQYIGIDMSKDSFHAAFDDHTVLVFENNPSGIKRFIKQLKSQETLIGVESTGVYHLLFARTLTTHGFKVNIINPIITHRMITSTLRKVKTDKADALAIRKTLITGAGYPFRDTQETLVFKALVSQREALVRTRAEMKQRIHVQKITQIAAGIKLPHSFTLVIRTLSREIKKLESLMSAYAQETQELLQSIPGVGRVVSAALIAHIGEIDRFASPEKLTAYLGLDCRVHQSGTSIHGKGFITKRGNAYLRFILFNSAFVARRHIPELKQFFEKKIKEGKHYFSASCAVERKLIHLIYAVWKRGTPYEKRLST